MYANVVTLNYKSPQDLEDAVRALAKQAEHFDKAPGFLSINMVRTGPTQTVHTVVFDTEENLLATREKMFPVLLEVTGPHVSAPPEQAPGEVLLHR